MVTASSPWCVSRVRVLAGLPRMLIVAMVLFGVVFTHGIKTESIKGYLSTTAAVALTDQAVAYGTAKARAPFPVIETDGQHDDPGSAHSAEHCASTQPQHGSAGTPACLAGSVREPRTSARSSLMLGLADVDFRGAWAVAMRSSTIQQV